VKVEDPIAKTGETGARVGRRLVETPLIITAFPVGLKLIV
jgi:hypothetical protein